MTIYSKFGVRKAVTKIQAILLALFIALSFLITPVKPAHAAAPTDVPVYLSQFGSTGSTTIQNPASVTIDSMSNVYVVDTSNNSIIKFDTSGNYITKWGSSGTGNGQFSSPYGITTDSSNNVYVADSGNNRIQKFDSSGTYLSQWGSFGTGDGQFNYPQGVITDSSDDVYVADPYNYRIQKFTSNGTYVSQWSTGSVSPLGITVDISGNVYVTDGNSCALVQKYTSSGTLITSWGSSGSGDGQFSCPTGIVTDASGTVYVVDSYNYRIQKFTSDGAYLAQWGTYGTGDGELGVDWPSGIIFDSKGNIVVADSDNNRIQSFAYPPDTASLTSTSGKAIQLTTAANMTLTCNSTATESSLAKSDPGYNYPLDLVNYCLTIPVAGATTTMILTFETDLTPSEVIARKYNSNTKTYADVPDVAIAETTLNGNHALQLTYNITDGGSLDEDGLANGTIIDPVGLATIAADPNSLAPTGSDTRLAYLVVSLLLLTGIGTLVVAMRKSNTQQ